MSTLSTDEFLRYQRQIALPDVGYEGQKRLKKSRVLIVGMGGLGAPVSVYLAAAGIGTLGLVDHDTVDISNLQRQIIYKTRDNTLSKVAAAKAHLQELNPHCIINTVADKLTANNVSLIFDYDIVVECSDNFTTKYLVNDACIDNDKPNISASIQQFSGHIAVFPGKNNACYRCLFPKIDDQSIRNCNEAGIVGTTAGIVGTLQAQQVIHFILDLNREAMLYTVDSMSFEFKKIRLVANDLCCHSRVV